MFTGGGRGGGGGDGPLIVVFCVKMWDEEGPGGTMALELASGIHKKKCGRCKNHLSLDCFKTRFVKGEKKLTACCTKCLDKQLDYHKTPEGKAAQKRFRESDKGQASQERKHEVVKKRRAKDPAYALRVNLAGLANKLVSGKYATSPTFLQHTAFVSEAQFLKHMHKKVEAMGSPPSMPFPSNSFSACPRRRRTAPSSGACHVGHSPGP